jgi:hypothetical protein
MMHCVNLPNNPSPTEKVSGGDHKFQEAGNMSTEMKQFADSAGEAATTVAEVAIGAAKTAAEMASDPIGSARKQVKGLERKGTPTARKVNRRFNARLNAATAPAKDAAKTINLNLGKAAKEAEKVASRLLPSQVNVWGIEVNGKLPENLAVKGLHVVKARAQRRDAVGSAAKRALRIFNGSFKTIARVATRLEHASDVTAPRAAASKPAARTRRPRRQAVRRQAA